MPPTLGHNVGGEFGGPKF